MAEGAPLLREYGVYSLIEGSNPSFSAINKKARRFWRAFLLIVVKGTTDENPGSKRAEGEFTRPTAGRRARRASPRSGRSHPSFSAINKKPAGSGGLFY